MQIIPYIVTSFLTVKDQFQDAFNIQPLDRYTFKERMVIRIAGFVFASLIRVIGKTLRFEISGQEAFDEVESLGLQPIHVFWHDRIVSGTYFFRNRKILVLSSTSFDSEYTARCIQRFGFGVIKGSSTRGGTQALVGMIRAMRAGFSTAFTLDGPKGPRYVAKSGPILLAKKSGCPMVPFILEPKRFWSIKSWDKLQIPKPFSKIKIFVGKPIFVDSEARDDVLEQKRIALQSSLDELVRQGAEWRCNTAHG